MGSEHCAKQTWGGILLDSPAWASITKYYKPNGLNNRHLSHGSGTRRPRSTELPRSTVCLQSCLLWRSWERTSSTPTLIFWWFAGKLWRPRFTQHRPDLCLHLHTVLSSSVSHHLPSPWLQLPSSFDHSLRLISPYFIKRAYNLMPPPVNTSRFISKTFPKGFLDRLPLFLLHFGIYSTGGPCSLWPCPPHPPVGSVPFLPFFLPFSYSHLLAWFYKWLFIISKVMEITYSWWLGRIMLKSPELPFLSSDNAQKDTSVWKQEGTPTMVIQALTLSAGPSWHYFALWPRTIGKTYINW